MAARRRPAREGSTEDSIVALRRHIVALRGELKEATTRFRLKWEAELHHLYDRLGGVSDLKDSDRRKAWSGYAKRMSDLLESTRIRPKRGRLRDLARVKVLAEKLREETPE